MHLPPFRPPGGAPTPRSLRLWVLLLLVPACFALVTMPVTIAAVAITLTFGVPLGFSLALHVHHPSEFWAQVPRRDPVRGRGVGHVPRTRRVVRLFSVAGMGSSGGVRRHGRPDVQVGQDLLASYHDAHREGAVRDRRRCGAHQRRRHARTGPTDDRRRAVPHLAAQLRGAAAGARPAPARSGSCRLASCCSTRSTHGTRQGCRPGSAPARAPPVASTGSSAPTVVAAVTPRPPEEQPGSRSEL